MNLCLACRDVEPDGRGGLARATCDLAEALAGQGHSIHLLTNASEMPAPVLRGVSIHSLPVPPVSGRCSGAKPESASHNLMHAAAAYREVRRIHEREEPVDAVLAPLWRSEGAVCALDDRFPTIVSCMTSLRTLTEIDPGYLRVPDIDERLRLEHETLGRARYLHGLTDSVLRKTIEDHGLRPDASTVIGRGLRDHGAPTRNEARDGRAVHVLFVGRLERRKGVDTLLAAARELVEGGVAVEFTLAGANADPSIREAFEREGAARPGLRAAVRFAGPVSDAELHRLYYDCDIVCAPSRYESHGVVLIEAMMFAKPIVTSGAGGIGEVVTADEDALVVPPGDPQALASVLGRLAASAELRAKLSSRARATYEQRFDAGAVALQMASFLERVIGAHQRVASDVAGRLFTLLEDGLALAPVDARELAGALLDPPASAWRAWAHERETGLRQEMAAQAATLEVLRERDETLGRIEQGGWWRLRERLLPLLWLARWLRARAGASRAR
ncbi:MAG TPA: glycosyltransferase family 4 protein [Solirubrobacteraceae bacterium]